MAEKGASVLLFSSKDDVEIQLLIVWSSHSADHWDTYL